MSKLNCALIGVLLAVIVGPGTYVYHEKAKPKGLELRIDGNGLSIQNN